MSFDHSALHTFIPSHNYKYTPLQVLFLLPYHSSNASMLLQGSCRKGFFLRLYQTQAPRTPPNAFCCLINDFHTNTFCQPYHSTSQSRPVRALSSSLLSCFSCLLLGEVIFIYDNRFLKLGLALAPPLTLCSGPCGGLDGACCIPLT